MPPYLLISALSRRGLFTLVREKKVNKQPKCSHLKCNVQSLYIQYNTIHKGSGTMIVDSNPIHFFGSTQDLIALATFPIDLLPRYCIVRIV